ncbi:hypothetical protein [Lichenibacterium ramalinae]|uniref:Uncharacterized protein n=1 Tax=Lichenibacterium ramalinae TaxID=2316527 RepID=A0A4V1RJ68_9HYPH|nr:hypothetical protein [Lichenibacterium ramalinae]RYB07268.1 hypothetical protein D3272_04210 [Lichenibacterium ramalinae]
MTATVTDQDRIHAVARALLDFDGHEPTGIRLGAAIVEATRMCVAWAVLRQLEPPPAPRKRRPVRQSTEH